MQEYVSRIKCMCKLFPCHGHINFWSVLNSRGSWTHMGMGGVNPTDRSAALEMNESRWISECSRRTPRQYHRQLLLRNLWSREMSQARDTITSSYLILVSRDWRITWFAEKLGVLKWQGQQLEWWWKKTKSCQTPAMTHFPTRIVSVASWQVVLFRVIWGQLHLGPLSSSRTNC